MYVPIFKIWQFSNIFIIIFLYLLLAVEYLLKEGDISHLTTFSTINSISALVGNSNYTSVIFKSACHANLGAKRNFAGSGLIDFEPHFSKVFKNICQ